MKQNSRCSEVAEGVYPFQSHPAWGRKVTRSSKDFADLRIDSFANPRPAWVSDVLVQRIVVAAATPRRFNPRPRVAEFDSQTSRVRARSAHRVPIQREYSPCELGGMRPPRCSGSPSLPANSLTRVVSIHAAPFRVRKGVNHSPILRQAISLPINGNLGFFNSPTNSPAFSGRPRRHGCWRY